MASLTNEAGWDRALRIVVGVVLLYLGWIAPISSANRVTSSVPE